MSDVKTTIDNIAKLVNAPLTISSEITVRNVVGTFRFGKELKLQNLYEKLRLHHKLSFEPELFPGIKIQVRLDNIIANVFLKGKVVVTGASSFAKLLKLEVALQCHLAAKLYKKKCFQHKQSLSL